MDEHAITGTVSLSVQATGNRGIPRNWHSRRLLLACALLFGLSGATTAWAADAIEIERANWSNDRDRLTVRGKNAPNNATVTISYGKIEDHGTELGTTQADGDGDWTFRIPNPDPVPCDVTAQAGGNADDKNVRRAPNNCSNEGGSQPPPANQTPTANANGPYAGTTGAAVSFSSAGSGDSDGTIASYNWTFGDGNTSSSANPNHSYATAGVYNVSLAVTDNQGAAASDSATATITVATASCTPGDLNVSINSTSQDGCPDAKVPQQAIVHNSTHSVLAINDLGMHCGDLDTRIASILPPFQVLLAQVVQKGGTPTLNPAGVTVYYSAASHNPGDLGPDDLIGDPILDSDVFDGVLADGNTYKTNFWDAVNQGTYDPFYPGGLGITPLASGGFPVTPDVGLPVPNVEELYIGADGVVDQNCDQPGATCDGTLTAVQHAMPGIAAPYTANNPKEAQEHYADKPFFMNFPFGYVAADVNWYEGAGVAFAAFDDNGRENAYPLVRVQAKNGNTVLSTVDTVLPISGEASCTNCHSTNMDYTGVHGEANRTDIPTDALSTAGLPVATSLDDPESTMPPKVSLEYAADINVLRLHDLKHGAKYVEPSPADDGTTLAAPCDITANSGNGDASCLTNKALMQDKPVVCQVCHYTPALDLAHVGPMTGPEGSTANGRNQVSHQSNSRVMHGHHGQFDDLFTAIPAPDQDPVDGSITNQGARLAALEQNCYQCHPGKNTQCLRGAMFNGGMLCSDCHGSMEQVGADFSANVSPSNPGAFVLDQGNFYDVASLQPRVPWANEPGCGSCHTGTATDNLAGTANTITNTRDIDGNVDGIRLRQAYRSDDPKATPIVPTNKRFAEPAVPTMYANADGSTFSNPGAGNPQLYRVSTGHGGVMCEGCHGATHAEWPNGNPNANDNVTANQLQGHVGALIECGTCHTNVNSLSPDATPSSLRGPHGLHAVGANTNFATGKHKEKLEEGQNKNACQACHGQDGLGTVLSRMAEERVLECKEDTEFCPDGKTALFPKGHAVGCVECHKNGLFED